MSLPPAQDEKKVTLEDQGNEHSNAPSLVSDDSFTNPTGINEKALLRRLDLKLLPPLTLLYLLSFLDRSNSMFNNPLIPCENRADTFGVVANAKLDGLTTDLHIT